MARSFISEWRAWKKPKSKGHIFKRHDANLECGDSHRTPNPRVWTFLPSPVSGDVNSPSFKGSVISTIFLTASAVDVNSPGFQAGVGRKKRLPPRRGG